MLGAIKVKDAEAQAVPERRRIEYLIASRYLTEARAYGMPLDREHRGLFFLGQSLIESGQFDDGLQVLNELAANVPSTDERLGLETQRLLAETCLNMPHPKINEALRHNDLLMANRHLSADERTKAIVRRAECLSRLGRFEEAQQTLEGPHEPR